VLAVFSRLQLARRSLEARLPGSRLRIRAIVVVLALWTRAATARQVPVPRLVLVVAGQRRALRIQDETEFFGAYEVFATSDYAINLDHPVRRVLDLGANVGFASMLLAERYPDAEIVALEPAPDTFATMVRNVASFGAVRPMQVAVGTDGPVFLDLNVPSVERHASRSGVEVRGISLTTLLDDLGWQEVDLMKIDAEGAEFQVFSDPAMSRVRAIVGEIHTEEAPAGYVGAAQILPSYIVDTNPAVSSSATMFRAVRRSREPRDSDRPRAGGS